MKTNPPLTMRENYLRAARRKNPQWVPMEFAITPGALEIYHKLAGVDFDVAEYFRYDTRCIGQNPTKQPTPDWRTLYYADGSLPQEAKMHAECGWGYIDIPDTDDRRLYFPLRNIQTAEEVDAFPWPDEGAAYRHEGLMAKVRDIQAKGYLAHFGISGIFESIWQLRGFEQLMLDMADRAPVAKRLFEHLYEIVIRSMEQGALTGTDVIATGGDVATQRGPMMSKTMWREYIYPLMRDGIRAAKKINPDILVFYHSCGNVTQFIEDFIEVGVDILNPVQPECMDIFELKRRYGKHISFNGGIGVQSVLPHGTPQQVKDMVRKTINVMAEGGGYICNTSHTLTRDIPWENVMALVETVREYGHP